jgi:hypothetical protein
MVNQNEGVGFKNFMELNLQLGLLLRVRPKTPRNFHPKTANLILMLEI